MPGVRDHQRSIASSLLAGAALTLVFATAARAQMAFDLPVASPNSAAPMLQHELTFSTPAIQRPPPPTDDALGQDGFYLEADSLVRDDKNKLWIARGQVEARYKGRVLRADEVIYRTDTGAVTANGHGEIINADGTAQFGQHMVMDDKMRAGFARGFAAREAQNITVAADVAIRRSETVNELDRAVYTPCDICAANGSAIAPTWSIQASRIIEDHDRHLIYYRNAVLRVKGLPVFYAPVFWHPDPTSPRQSGFLAPDISTARKRGGFSYEQPYLWVINPSTEVIVSPQINAGVNPFLNVEYHERFYSGRIDARVGYTYEQDFEGDGDKFGSLTSRSYILGNGEFDLTPNWTWGFGLEHTSDPLLFAKYDIPAVYQDRGLYEPDTQRLLSQVYATRQDSDSYFSIDTMDFQGLRQYANPANPSTTLTENNSVFPFVSPLIEARYDPKYDVLGGRLHVEGGAVVLSRSESPVDASAPGPNSRRLSGDVNWQSAYTLDDGLRFEPFVDLRGSYYNISDLSATNLKNQSIGEGLPTAGLNVSWPFIRSRGGTTVVLEPVAQLVLSPDIKPNPNIPNEDSTVFDYDETTLFEPNKFSGWDLFDSGQRVNLGERTTIEWDKNLTAHFVVGRTFRTETTDIFPTETGLNNTSSNWVLSADVTPFNGVTVYARGLLDARGDAPQAEVGANFAFSRVSGYLRYEIDNAAPSTNVTATSTALGVATGVQATAFNDFEGATQVFLTDHWGVGINGVRDLTANAWRLEQLDLIYKDDCIRVDVIYQHQNTLLGVGDLGVSDTVFVRLTLATLGDQGYSRGADAR